LAKGFPDRGGSAIVDLPLQAWWSHLEWYLSSVRRISFPTNNAFRSGAKTNVLIVRLRKPEREMSEAKGGDKM
jgi:hypothetical protein